MCATIPGAQDHLGNHAREEMTADELPGEIPTAAPSQRNGSPSLGDYPVDLYRTNIQQSEYEDPLCI